MFPQTILEVFTQTVLYGGPALTGFYYISIFYGFKIGRCVSLGEAAGQTISTPPKGLIKVAALPDIGRLGAHVVGYIVVKVAFLSKRALFVLLQRWKSSCRPEACVDFERDLFVSYT